MSDRESAWVRGAKACRRCVGEHDTPAVTVGFTGPTSSWTAVADQPGADQRVGNRPGIHGGGYQSEQRDR